MLLAQRGGIRLQSILVHKKNPRPGADVVQERVRSIEAQRIEKLDAARFRVIEQRRGLLLNLRLIETLRRKTGPNGPQHFRDDAYFAARGNAGAVPDARGSLVQRVEAADGGDLVKVQQDAQGLFLAGDEHVDHLSAHGKLAVDGHRGDPKVPRLREAVRRFLGIQTLAARYGKAPGPEIGRVRHGGEKRAQGCHDQDRLTLQEPGEYLNPVAENRGQRACPLVGCGSPPREEQGLVGVKGLCVCDDALRRRHHEAGTLQALMERCQDQGKVGALGPDHLHGPCAFLQGAKDPRESAGRGEVTISLFSEQVCHQFYRK